MQLDEDYVKKDRYKDRAERVLQKGNQAVVTVKKDNEAAFRLVIEGLGAIPVFPMDQPIDYSNLLLIIRLEGPLLKKTVGTFACRIHSDKIFFY